MIKPKGTLKNVIPYQMPEQSRMDKIRLDLNESAWGCSDNVKRRLQDLTYDEISAYPEYDVLMKKLAKHYGLNEENILLSNGADDSIRCVFDTYLERDDEIIIPVPNYSMFDFFARIRGANQVEIRYNDDFTYPVDAVLDHVNVRTKFIIIVNPANPLGTVINRSDLIRILKNAPNTMIFLDETYHHFMNESYAHLIHEFENLVITHTFSKIYGLAGLRLGVTLAQSHIIENFNKINLPFAANVAAVKAAEVAIDENDFVEDIVRKVNTEKKYLHENLKILGYDPYDTKTNFFIVNMEDDSTKVHEKLKHKNILVKNLEHYPMLNGYLRISIGRHEQNMKLLETLTPELMPEAIIFDMDGVLVDVTQSYRLAIQKTVEHFSGQGFNLDDIDVYKSRGGYNNDWILTQAVLRDRGIDLDLATVIDTFHGYYLGSNFDGLILNEEWLPEQNLLENLSKSCKLGIFTGRPRLDAEFVLNRFNATHYFSSIITLDETPEDKGKPHPYGIQEAMKQLDKTNAIYVGDTIDDMKSAVAANIVPIGILHKDFELFHRRSLLRKNGARLILPSVNELTGILG